MKQYRKISKVAILLLFVVLGGVSCTTQNEIKPPSVGKTTDMIVATDKATMGELKTVITGVFEKNQPYFAFTEEPYFNAIGMNFKGMKGSLLKHKSITILVHEGNKSFVQDELDIDVDGLLLKMKDGHFISIQDVWARNQHVIVIYAKDSKGLATYLQSHSEKVLSSAVHAETKDLYKRLLTSKKSEKNYMKLKEQYGCGIRVPDSYELKHQKDGFFWYMEDTENYTSSITVYGIPYEDTAQFNIDYLLGVRDSLAKVHIPGELDGTYMSTVSKDKFYRFEKVKNYNGVYTKEIRGNWSVKGEFKAGPFIMYAMLHEPSQTILLVDGFLMYPDNGKRKSPFLRVYESLPWSFK